MDCYKQLDFLPRAHILASLFGSAILLTHAIYSGGVWIYGSSWFPIPFAVLDTLFIIGLLCRIWYIVYSNEVLGDMDGWFFAGVLIAIYFLASYGFVLGYMLCVFSTGIIPFLPQELVVVLPYLIILTCAIAIVFYLFVDWVRIMILETSKIIDSRKPTAKINDLSHSEDEGKESQNVSVEISQKAEYEPLPLQ